jgi:hypothetical protein
VQAAGRLAAGGSFYIVAAAGQAARFAFALPVMAVGASPSADAIASRARDSQIVAAAGGGFLPAPAAGRAQAAEAILRMLDRLS